MSIGNWLHCIWKHSSRYTINTKTTMIPAQISERKHRTKDKETTNRSMRSDLKSIDGYPRLSTMGCRTLKCSMQKTKQAETVMVDGSYQ